MPTATLRPKGLNRIHVYGHLFLSGIPQPVSNAVATQIETGEYEAQFKVVREKLDPTPAPTSKSTRPADAATRVDMIRDAMLELDEDVDSNWTTNGKPDARALTSILGWQVTSEDRDAAVKDEGQTLTRSARRSAARGGGGDELMDTGADAAGGDADAVEVG